MLGLSHRPAAAWHLCPSHTDVCPIRVPSAVAQLSPPPPQPMWDALSQRADVPQRAHPHLPPICTPFAAAPSSVSLRWESTRKSDIKCNSRQAGGSFSFGFSSSSIAFPKNKPRGRRWGDSAEQEGSGAAPLVLSQGLVPAVGGFFPL